MSMVEAGKEGREEPSFYARDPSPTFRLDTTSEMFPQTSNSLPRTLQDLVDSVDKY